MRNRERLRVWKSSCGEVRVIDHTGRVDKTLNNSRFPQIEMKDTIISFISAVRDIYNSEFPVCLFGSS